MPRLNGGFDLLNLLGAEEAVFTAVRVKTGDGNPGICDAQFKAGLIGNLDDFKNARFFDAVAGFTQRNMGGRC